MSATEEPGRGYLTMAAGNRRYLEMAVDMVLSLRDHTSYPIGLAADEAVAEVAATSYPGVFDAVALLPQRMRTGRALKYGLAAASPFEETAFVDADCLVLGSLDHVWRALETSDMAMLGELLTEDDDENHHGFSTRALMRTFGIDRYLKTNSGLFCFRRTAALEIMEECLRCYLDEVRPRLRWSVLRGAWLGDEIAFGVVGGRRRLGTLAKPAEMYWPDEFDAIDLGAPAKPLLHFLWPLTDETFDAAMAEAERRRVDAGVPVVGSEHWQREQDDLRSMAKRRRLLERLKIW